MSYNELDYFIAETESNSKPSRPTSSKVLSRSKTEPTISNQSQKGEVTSSSSSDGNNNNNKTNNNNSNNNNNKTNNNSGDEKPNFPCYVTRQSLLSSPANNRKSRATTRPSYRDSSLHYDTQLFINKHIISLTSPITTESLEREELLYGYTAPKTKVDFSDNRRKSNPISPKRSKSRSDLKQRGRSTYRAKPKSVVSKPDIDRLTREPDEIDTPRSTSPVRIPYIPRRSFLYSPRRYHYPFEPYLDNIDWEIKAFERELDLIKFRRPRYYISPFRLAKYYESIRGIEEVYRQMELVKPPPPPPSIVPAIEKTYVPKYTPRFSSPTDYSLYDVEKRIGRLDSRAYSLNNTIQHLRSIWDY